MYVVKSWLLFLGLLPLSGFVDGYVFQCPYYSQWHRRSEQICNTTEKYFCLHDDNKEKNKEFCKSSFDVERSGYKIVIRGSLQGEICDDRRYQPIKFWTNGSSDCIFAKSTCNEEGQSLYNIGTNKHDTACRCDFNRGYSFIIKPYNLCFCVPSLEDCSCYIKNCATGQIPTPDYRCVYTYDWKPPFSCALTTASEASGNNASFDHNVLNISPSRKSDVQDDGLYAAYIVISGMFLMGAWVVVLFVKGKENGDPLLDEWKDNLRYFSPTTASKTIRRKIYENQCTLITGPPGCGKTAIAYYIAFELEKTEGYAIMPVSLPKDLSKLKKATWFCCRKHVFIVDNVIGIETVSSCNTTALHNAIKTTLSKASNLKIIMTCRSHIYSMNIFVGDYFYHCDMLLSNMELSMKERKEILSRYHEDDFINKIGLDDLALYSFFPALCALSLQTENHSPAIFSYPFAFLNKEIEYMMEKYDVLYLALALLVVNNGIVEMQMLDEDNNYSDKMFCDIYSESGFQQPPSKFLLRGILKSLNGTLLLETDTFFSFLNDNLFQVISSTVGSAFVRSIILHGNTSFKKKRLQLASLNEQFDNFTILVKPQLETLFFDKLLGDLKIGYVWNSLDNLQLQYSQFRKNLIIRLKKQHELKNVKDVVDDSTVLHVTSHLGYYDLFLHFLRNDRPGIDQTNKRRRTALHVACEREMWKIAKSLISNGATIDAIDIENRTALHLACENGNKKIVELLLSHKAEINIPDCNGLTPLHIACSEGHFAVVKLLIENHSNLECKDKHGRTPLMIAREKEKYHTEKSKQIIELFKHKVM